MADQAPIIILLAPVFGALAVTLIGLWRSDRCLPVVFAALGISVAAALVSAATVYQEGVQTYFFGGWDDPLGIGIGLRIDLMSAIVVVVIAVVAMITAVFSLENVEVDTPGKAPQFYTLYLLLATGLMGIVMTADAFNLYVLLEVSSLTSYGLVAMGKSKRGTVAAFNYIIMGTIGASFYLLGVGYLYIKTGTLNMIGIREVLQAEGLFGSQTVFVAFLLIMVGVWIKMALFPLYGWLPNAYSYAPSSTGCLVAPLMTKVAVYIMIRMILTVFGPDYVFEQLSWSEGVIRLAVLGIVAGSLMALAQTDLKKMLCYLIVAEVGYMVGGAWLGNQSGMVGAIYHIISDAFMTLCLFLAASIFFRKTGTNAIAGLDGLYRKMPWTMAAFTLGAFAMIGIPPTCGFFSKWYLLRGGIEAGAWDYVVALLLSSLVNAVLFFRIIEIAYFGRLPDPEGDDGEVGVGHPPEQDGPAVIDEAPPSMLIPLITAAVALVLIGLFNADLADLIRTVLEPYAVVGGGNAAG